MPPADVSVVYSPRYSIITLGLERLHPFDVRKYKHAWRSLDRICGPSMRLRWLKPPEPVSRDELLRVHTADYLDALRRDSSVAARAVEVPELATFPASVIDRALLRPLRWITAGTIRAAETALVTGGAINIGGGYHHACPDHGEGFCIYADAALAIRTLYESKQLSAENEVICVDLDAHMGNGVARQFLSDTRVRLFDMYNATIYPQDDVARKRLDRDLGLVLGREGDEYLVTLRRELPPFLDAFAGDGDGKLMIYNAGTDVFEHDALGGFGLSEEQVFERDRFVIEQAEARGLPWVLPTSGGYSARSYAMIAATTRWAIARADAQA